MAKRVYLIREVNCYETEPLPPAWIRRLAGLETARRVDRQSLWIAAEPFEPSEDDYEQRATRIVGPADPIQLDAVLTRLRNVLVSVGVDVVEATVSDD